MELAGSRAVVTGGARGMGRTFVEALRAEGAQVAFCDVDGVEEAASATGAFGFRADVSDETSVEGFFDQASEALGGPPTILINNAGITRDHLLIKAGKDGTIVTHSKAAWDAVIGVNLTGPFLCMRAFARRLVEAGIQPAVAVNLSSISRAGNRGQSSYSATKAGIVADTKLWAEELARHGIRVGAVAPGFIATPMVEAMRPEVLAKLLGPVPLGRLGRPEEIWQAVRFILVCDYFTGRVVEVDGGLVV